MPNAKVSRLDLWRHDLTAYAADCLKVLTKAGKIVPLHLNAAQRSLNAFIEQCLAERGRARVVVPKGRQVGVSTDSSAWFTRDTQLFGGVRVSVIAHRKDATANLAEMTRRFYDYLPLCARQETVKRNDTQLMFGNESSYTLGTAGQSADPGATGRSRTATRLHASEYAFWVKAGDRMAGLGQAVADEDGTIAIAESTAQGQANAFYDLYQLGVAEVGDWRSFFIPWFVEPAYTREPPPGYTLSREAQHDHVPSDHDYREEHDLTLGQMYWRELKLQELGLGSGDGMVRWCQEYPATAEEAFLTTGQSSFHNALVIAAARKRSIDLVDVGPADLVIGIDPATSHGTDLTVFVRRRHLKAYGLEAHARIPAEEIIARAWEMWLHERPRVFTIDRSEGVGDAVFMALSTRGVPCIGVYFGGKPDLRERYYDRRSELQHRLDQWLPLADIPDDTDLAVDLLAQRKEPLEGQRIRLVQKHKLILQDGHRSPDRSDALATTFAFIDPERRAGPPLSAGSADGFNLPPTDRGFGNAGLRPVAYS